MRYTIVLLMALIAGCATQLPVNPPAGMSAVVEPVAPAVGETWAYTVRDGYTGLPHGIYRYRVEEINPAFYTVLATQENAQGAVVARNFEHYTLQGNWLEKAMTNLPVFHYDPPYAAFSLPLTAGRSWQSFVTAVSPTDGRRNRVRIDGSVLGWERIAVPAGLYDTLKIRRIVYAGNHDYFRGEENIAEYEWYSPTLNRVVKRETNSGYVDKTRSCGPMSSCGWVQNDWLIWELVGQDGGGKPRS